MSRTTWERDMRRRAETNTAHSMPYRATKFLNRVEKKANRMANIEARREANKLRASLPRAYPNWRPIQSAAATYKPRDIMFMSVSERKQMGI